MSVPRHERGWAMLWALALLAAAGTLGAVLLERDQAMRRDAVRDAAALRTVYALEGGLAQLRHALARDADYEGATVRIGDIELQIVIRKQPASAWIAEIRAPGRGRGLRAALRASPGLPRVTSRGAL